MRLEVIHLDNAHEAQSAFQNECARRGATIIDATREAPRLRLWCWDEDLGRLAEKLPVAKQPALSILGSGDFHHVSALLIERAAAECQEPFTVVHFDNHPDWVHCGRGMHCGSWVNRALYVPEVAKVITAGICSKDLQHPEFKGGNLSALRAGKLEIFAYRQAPSSVSGHYGSGVGFHQDGGHLRWHTIEEMGMDAFAAALLAHIHTPAIYITLDKDVLSSEDAVTNWDQGQLRLDDVIRLIRDLGAHHRIAGADVIGDYSRVHYSGGAWPFIRKWGETLIDHPRVRLEPAAIAARNEAANLRLVQTFAEVMQ